jgi:hypothetical protein
MHKSFLKNFFLFCIGILLFAGCAQVLAPSGGPKDTTPPKVLSFSPENKSLHFSGHKIVITFDEYIQLKNLTTQLITSPPLKYQPKAVLIGKSLEITFKDTLLNNTTYTFNFGNAISDNNEGNELKNFQYVFSTGDYLDSLSLSGNVQSAFTHDPGKQAMILLFANMSDSAIYKGPPSYVGLANDQGNYKIENIKVGTYKVISLSKNQEYIYHPYTEEIGYGSKPLTLQHNDTLNLESFTEQEPKLVMRKARATGKGEITIVFNKPADSLHIVPINLAPATNPPYAYLKYSATHDTVIYWTNIPNLDSLRFVVYKNNTIIDTGFAHSFPGYNPQDKRKPKPTKVHFTSNVSRPAGFDFHEPIRLQFDVPVLKFNLSKIRMAQGKDSMAFSADTSGLPMFISLTPAKAFVSDSLYRLYILSGAFADMYGGSNDTSDLHFKVLEPTYFGTLKLNLQFPAQNHYLVQLLDDKNNVATQDIITGTKTIFYSALLPGNYRIRVIEDANANGKWDAGNYMKGIQPEKVFYYPQVISIRSNWDLTQTWLVK